MKEVKIRKPIGDVEYSKLMTHYRGTEDIKEHLRTRLLRTFSFLFFSGCRINELPQLTVKHLKQIFETGETVIMTHKTSSPRTLFFKDKAIEELKKYFNFDMQSEDSDFVICKWDKPRELLNYIYVIDSTNVAIKAVLGDNYTSHSFRSGIITAMSVKSVNPKVIQKFIGHKNVTTTLNYCSPSDEEIKNALVR